jgi:hypothetical protein
LASTLNLITGIQSSGVLSDTYTDNGVYLDIDEVAGIPGYDIQFVFGDFDAVPTTALRANFRAYYTGNLGHNVKLQQWNYNTTTWTDVPGATFPDEITEQLYTFTLIDDPNYIQANQIELRVIHTSSGNPTHQFRIDQLILELAGKLDVLFKGMGRGMFRKMR